MYYVYVDRMFHEVFQDFKKAEDYCLYNAERYGWEDWCITGERKQVLSSKKENRLTKEKDADS